MVSEVHEKLEILKQHRKSDVGPHYITVQSMVNYEVSNNITTTKNTPPSGSRTLLRLHRALQFIILFMERLPTTEDHERLSHVASASYNETLAKYHGWFIRKGIALAMYTLPSRVAVLEKMEGTTPERTVELLEMITKSAHPLYDTIQQVYIDNDLLDLP